jgi:hypothetical protein
MNILVGIREEVARAGYRVEAQTPGTFGVATPRRIEYGQFCRYPACRGVLAWDSMRRRRHSNPTGRAPTLSNLGRPTRIAAFGKSVALGLAGTAAAAFVGLPDSLQDDSDAPADTDPAPDSGRSDAHTGTRFERGNGAAQPIFDSWKLRAKRGQVVAVLVDGVELLRIGDSNRSEVRCVVRRRCRAPEPSDHADSAGALVHSSPAAEGFQYSIRPQAAAL